MTYAEQLKHPLWQKRRLEVFQKHGFACCNCGSKERTLHVHHGYYEKGLKAWEYGLDTLWPLCEECHDEAQSNMHDLQLALARMTPTALSLLTWKLCTMENAEREAFLFEICAGKVQA